MNFVKRHLRLQSLQVLGVLLVFYSLLSVFFVNFLLSTSSLKIAVGNILSLIVIIVLAGVLWLSASSVLLDALVKARITPFIVIMIILGYFFVTVGIILYSCPILNVIYLSNILSIWEKVFFLTGILAVTIGLITYKRQKERLS